MFTIKIIDNIFIKDNRLYEEGRRGIHTMVLLKQGQLDGACGIYSLLMLLILHKRVNSEDLTTDVFILDPPHIKRLKERLLNPLKGIRSHGTTMSDLQGLLLKIFDDNINVGVFYDSKNGGDDYMLHYRLRNQLDRGYPVLVAYRKNKKYGHVVVAIGYTMLEGFMRLYCLDPSENAPWCNFWNNIIDIKITDSDEDYPDYNHRTGKNVKGSFARIQIRADLKWSVFFTRSCRAIFSSCHGTQLSIVVIAME